MSSSWKKFRTTIHKKKAVFIPLFTVVGVFVLVGVGIGVFELMYMNRIYPHVYFDSIALGGKTVSEASAIIRKETDAKMQLDIAFTLPQGETASVGRVADYASYDVDKTAQHAYALGRSGSIGAQVNERTGLLRYSKHVAPVYAYNRADFEQKFTETFRPFQKPVVNAGLVLNGENLKVTPAQSGMVADQGAAVGEFERFLAFQRESPSISITVAPKDPEITDAEAARVANDVQRALSRPLTLSSTQISGSTWNLTREQLFSLIELQKENDRIAPRVVDYKVASWSGQIAQLVNRDPVDAKFEFAGDRVGQFEPAQPGLELDTVALTQKISEHVFNLSLPATVEIPLKVTQPALSTENVNNYGIKELVATGKSKFKGSPAGRIHNLALASSKLNGVLIAPDEVFSMYKVVGEVEQSTGYQDAFIIKDGRTVPGVGGGLCQVSTTLFRAALNAGLPIVERHQHAYRVYYYEQDSPAGVDAAVYFPSWDFKFKNDTGNYLLLQTKVDTKAMTAEFNLYGVKDGRTVDIGKPVLTNQTPPPPELRVDDPTLARGQENEVDHAVWGADAQFGRKVFKDGKEHLNDTFKSKYKAWQRVVMVGVKD